MLDKIFNDLKNHKHTRSEAMEICIKKRLAKCDESYINEIEDSMKFLSNRNTLNMLKRLGR